MAIQQVGHGGAEGGDTERLEQRGYAIGRVSPFRAGHVINMKDRDGWEVLLESVDQLGTAPARQPGVGYDEIEPALGPWSTGEVLIGGNQYDMPRVPRWWHGPMIVIGDAAHAASPSSGQGASLAMEDGVTLAQCLRDLPDTRSAFLAYEKLRRPRVERIVAWAARMNSNKAPGPMARALRDLLLPLILRRQGNADSQRWVYDHHIEWGARVPVRRAA